jgi:NAD(P)-dependent dehydrogenase (short-subunit alcohol dehydrogenase family)
MELRCRSVLVTGGSSGIGLALARRLTDLGASVVITGRDEQKLATAKAQIASDRLFTLPWDISDVRENRENIRKAAALMGGLDGLVNNAGAAVRREYEPWDITEAEWDSVMDTNLKGAFFLMRDTVDYMLEHRIRGNVVNVASNAACMDIRGPYGASKLAMIKLTRAYGKRLGHQGIIVNGVAPGATFTPMISDYALAEDQPYPRHAIERFIRPEEIAEWIVTLMSRQGETVCGHTVVADGGDELATL